MAVALNLFWEASVRQRTAMASYAKICTTSQSFWQHDTSVLVWKWEFFVADLFSLPICSTRRKCLAYPSTSLLLNPSFKIKQAKNVSSFLFTHPCHAVGSCKWQWIDATSAQMSHIWEAEASEGAGYNKKDHGTPHFHFVYGWAWTCPLRWRVRVEMFSSLGESSTQSEPAQPEAAFLGLGVKFLHRLTLVASHVYMAGGLAVLLEVTAVNTQPC